MIATKRWWVCWGSQVVQWLRPGVVSGGWLGQGMVGGCGWGKVWWVVVVGQGVVISLGLGMVP